MEKQININIDPEYTKDEAYQLLCVFCKTLGIPVVYSDSDKAISHINNTDDSFIEMPSKCGNFRDMAIVLAHEIAHFLIEDLFVDKFDRNSEDYRAPYLIEHNCDMLGYGIYLLAKRIAEEADANGEKVVEYIAKSLYDNTKLS